MSQCTACKPANFKFIKVFPFGWAQINRLMQLLFSDQNSFLPLNFNRFKNSAAIIDIYSQRILMETGLLSRLHALMNKKCL